MQTGAEPAQVTSLLDEPHAAARKPRASKYLCKDDLHPMLADDRRAGKPRAERSQRMPRLDLEIALDQLHR
jgi:hypothetical protein